jgi:septal ring factor EnvC (AmiA/AmiB activator)
MKKLNIILLTALCGCKFINNIDEVPQTYAKAARHFVKEELLGIDPDRQAEVDSQQQKELDAHAKSIALLEKSNDMLNKLSTMYFNAANNSISEFSDVINDLQSDLLALEQQILDLEVADDNIETELASLSAKVDEIESAIEILDVEEIEVINVCDNDEEILLKIGTKVIAYFKESGSKEYLKLLVPGETYESTDGEECEFSVDENGEIVESEEE